MAVAPAAKIIDTRKKLGLILLAGLLLRLVWPGSIGLDHFDEGIYAFAGEWPFARGGLAALDPALIPYGPPVTSVLIGISNIVLGGPSDFSAILPGLLCGSLAVVVIGRLAAKSFTPQAGLFSAILLATSGAGIAFSRSALTDAPLMLVWLSTIYCGLHFLKRPGFISAMGLGIGVGLSQLTKYNGALTGVIVALTALLDVAYVPREKVRDFHLFAKRIGWGLFAILIAFLIYLPWIQFVERHGGYRTLMKHHSGYMGGVETWFSHLKLQLAQASVFQWQWSLMILVVLACIWVGDSNQNQAKETKIKWPAVLTTLLCLIPNAIWICSIIRTPRLLRSPEVGLKLIAVWLIFLSILTPFYHPYARLWLPTTMASFLVAGSMLDDIWSSQSLSDLTHLNFRTIVREKKFLAGLLIFFVVTSFQMPLQEAGFWSGRGALKADVLKLVPQIQASVSKGRTVSLYVSPAVRWQLRNATPPAGFGPGRLANLPDLHAYQSGPLLLDRGLLNEREYEEFLKRNPRIKKQLQSEKSQRGLISILDIAPDASLGSPIPGIGLEWLGD